MRFGVVIFPGSNCDHDLIYLLQEVYQQEVVELWHKDTDLQGLTTALVGIGVLWFFRGWLSPRRSTA